MSEHAVLSASASHRWLECPPSAVLEQQFPDENSSYAAEGTAAHRIAELGLRYFLGEITSSFYKESIKDSNPEMLDYVEIYLSLAKDRINQARQKTPDAAVLIEQKLDFSPWVPQGYGTGDLIIIADNHMEIIDLKYGKGVLVSAEGNSQMRLYALGAVHQFESLYDFDQITMTICQPRLDHIASETVSVDELLAWGDQVKAIAQLAIEGRGDFKAGEHCRFCRARFTCRTRADANLELAKLEFAPPALLSDDEIVEVLAKAEQLQAWVSDIKAYALEQARDHGKVWPGWKLVEGRSNRKYIDEAEVIKTLIQAGYDENVITEKSILPITKMEKLLGKKRFNELLKDLVFKPPGAPTLVPESDNRPEWNRNQAAINDFKEECLI